MMAVNEPRGSSTLTPSRAATAPSPWPWTLRTSRRAMAGAATAVGAKVGVGVLMPRTLPAGRRRSHPASLPSGVRAGPLRGRLATPCAGPAARLESAAPDDPLHAMGSRARRARGPSARARAYPGAAALHGSHAQRVVLAGAVGGGGRRRLRGSEARALGRWRAGPGARGDPSALRPLLRGVRPRRVAPAAGQRGRPPADPRGLRHPGAADRGSDRHAADAHARHAVRRALDRRL